MSDGRARPGSFAGIGGISAPAPVTVPGAGAAAGPEQRSFNCCAPCRNNSWREVVIPPSRKAPRARSGAASIVLHGKLYVFGGYGGDEGRLDDFWEFDLDKRGWKRIENGPGDGVGPGPRENNGLVDHDGKLYLYGGYDGFDWLDDFYEFDTSSRRWRCISAEGGESPGKRFGYVSVTHDGVMLLFGGYDGASWMNDLYGFDFASEKWAVLTATGTPPSPRSCPSWTKHNRSVYVFGGYDGSQRMNDFFVLNLDTLVWAEVATKGDAPSPRYFHSCAFHGESFFVFGGYNGCERLNDFYEYDFRDGVWNCRIPPCRSDTDVAVACRESVASMPCGRSSMVSQMYKHSLLVFGGYNGHNVLSDFYEYRFSPVVVPPAQLTLDLQRLINNEELSDVTFLVEGRPVYASRIHLAVRCEAFRAMLFGGMREAHAGSDPIPLPGATYAAFLKLLEYVYTDDVSELPHDVALDLLVLSESFLLERLKCLCELTVQQGIAVDTVVRYLIGAHRHNAQGLKEQCMQWVLDHFDELKEHESFAELKGEPDVLFDLLLRQSSTAACVSPPAARRAVTVGVAQGVDGSTSVATAASLTPTLRAGGGGGVSGVVRATLRTPDGPSAPLRSQPVGVYSAASNPFLRQQPPPPPRGDGGGGSSGGGGGGEL